MNVKMKHNSTLQGLGETKTGYCAEKIRLFPQMKTSKNLTLVYIAFLYPPENALPCKAMWVHHQLVITFMLSCYAAASKRNGSKW